ncbi:MAG: hypothetical protein VXZ15_01475, partial [Planctomycetota bacterium]|nr:hypothetical protein [Planctomycetota bacterium]
MSLSQKISVYIVLLGLGLIPDQEAWANEPVSFRAMAWNIWHGGREDGEQIGPQRVVDIIEKNRV